MKTNLKAGQILDSGFEVLEVIDLAELKSAGIWARHQKSGAEVFHILNDDPENLFSFAFATAPEDNTGAAHILEHSVLCGSEQYPLKDAFLVLAQGSLQTFLNAWTFPDKTVYPASSVNEHDYFNLMSVYGDAVFRPLLSEWTFMQEGWRLTQEPNALEFSVPENSTHSTRLGYTGVVYNEMKGAYSSLDTYAGLWSIKAALPGTPYAFESGGDPEYIPDLSREGLRDFHRKRYSPANCRIFLAGNIPTEKQLAFLDEKFFSSLEPGTAAPPIPKTEKWDTPREFRISCPAGGDEKPTVFISWRCGDVTDTTGTLALAALAEILLGHDGSPLTRALIESGLGEDLTPVSGLEGEIRETVFVAGLRGCAAADGGAANIAAQVEALILGELRRLAEEGIPKEEIEAALSSMEFSHREIRRSGGPFSLVWMRRALRGWLHGTKPWESLLFDPDLAKMKQRLAADNFYFESLIKKYFLDNPHRALVSIEPAADFLAKQDAKLADALAKKEAALNKADRQALKEKADALEKIQSEGERPEALATIPHLSRKDLSAEIETVPRTLQNAGLSPVLAHELFTNGISYADLAFPLDVFSPKDYPWLPLFSRAVVSVGLPGVDYGEVSSLLARTAGGFNALLQSGTPAPFSARSAATPAGILDLVGRDWIIYRLKALDEKIGPSLDLARRLITQADFSDQRRVRDLVLEMKNEADSSLAPSGHSFASSRSGCFYSRSRAIDEIWSGLTQIEFAHQLAAMDIEEIVHKLAAIRDTLAVNAGLIINLTGSAETLKTSQDLAEKEFGHFGPPRPRNPATDAAAPFFTLLNSADLSANILSGSPAVQSGMPPDAVAPAPGKNAVVYASPSLQVGFAALSFAASPCDTPEQAAELALSHQLSTGALWEDIRMKGGAYGAFANPDSLEGVFSFATYRDPNPLRSLEAFTSILKNSAGKKETPENVLRKEDELTKVIIGCYARETRPRTSAEKGLSDFLRFLYGIEDGYRRRKLERLINVSGDQIDGVLQGLASQNASSPVIIAGTKTAEKAAKTLGAELRRLPV